MFCTKCGAKIEDGAKFCTSCGQPIGEAAAPTTEAVPAEKKDTVGELVAKAKTLGAKLKPALKKVDDKARDLLGDKKNYAYAGVLVLLGLIITISVLAAMIPDGNGYLACADVELAEADGDIYLFEEGKLVKIKSDAKRLGVYKHSIDGKAVVFESDGSLYEIKGDKAKAFAEDVDKYSISLYGDSVVYSVEDNITTTSYYYAKVGEKSVRFFESEVELLGGKLLISYVISPDGESIAYTASEDGETNLYYFNGKKSTKIAECGGSVVGMSNGGKYIYVSELEGIASAMLYVYNQKGKCEEIGSCIPKFWLNLDGTEIMYHSDGKTYVSSKGKEAVKVASAELTLRGPGYINTYTALLSVAAVTEIMPVESFFEHIYTYGTAAYYVSKNENNNCKLVRSDSTSFFIDDSAEYLYYFEDDTLMCLEIAKCERAEDKAKEIAEDVERFVVSSDRKYLYYISDDELYVVNGKKGGKAKVIASDVVNYKLVISRDDHVYYACDDYIYAAKGKGNAKRIMEYGDIEELGGYVLLYDEDYTIYAARGKSKPKKLLDID